MGSMGYIWRQAASKGGTRMPANKCDECGTKINRLKTPYKFKHGNHTHAFCDPP